MYQKSSAIRCTQNCVLHDVHLRIHSSYLICHYLDQFDTICVTEGLHVPWSPLYNSHLIAKDNEMGTISDYFGADRV